MEHSLILECDQMENLGVALVQYHGICQKTEHQQHDMLLVIYWLSQSQNHKTCLCLE